MDTEHISCITKHNKSMSTIICGACDGEVEDDKSIKQWNIEAPVHGVREEPINMILGKVIVQLRSNTLCWNPMETHYITCANEDYKCTTLNVCNMSSV